MLSLLYAIFKGHPHASFHHGPIGPLLQASCHTLPLVSALKLQMGSEAHLDTCTVPARGALGASWCVSMRSFPLPEKSMNVYQEALCHIYIRAFCGDPDRLGFSSWELCHPQKLHSCSRVVEVRKDGCVFGSILSLLIRPPRPSLP